MPSPLVLRLDRLTRTFREGDATRTVLDGVTARLDPGTFAALYGRSGSGKSTLLNLIAGLDTPTAGHVWLGDIDLTTLSERDRTLVRRNRMGFVFQSFNLIPTLTVRENVRLPLDLARQTDEADVRADALLDAVGLSGRGDAFPDRLSGGEQQRVAVARALANRPELVLADEPTGNLDEVNADRVLDLLAGLAKDEGRTLLVVTHDPGIARRADTVLHLVDGRLVDG
ncbi:MAG: ABC transporter ATP-binding protein [Rhodothermales bacterium]|nr:ABC transporter ATP-binding protein [Rhodothermales bacterium]